MNRIGFENFYKKHMQDNYKEAKRNMDRGSEIGYKLERYVEGIMALSDLDIKKTPDRLDLCYGADFLVSYDEGGQHSFYLDITLSKRKQNMKFLKANGELTSNYSDAFTADFGFGSVSFGLKTKHGGHFIYEKPVVVMIFSKVNLSGKGVKGTDTEIRLVEALLKSVHQKILEDYKVTRRASKMIYPNPSRYGGTKTNEGKVIDYDTRKKKRDSKVS